MNTPLHHTIACIPLRQPRPPAADAVHSLVYPDECAASTAADSLPRKQTLRSLKCSGAITKTALSIDRFACSSRPGLLPLCIRETAGVLTNERDAWILSSATTRPLPNRGTSHVVTQQSSHIKTLSHPLHNECITPQPCTCFITCHPKQQSTCPACLPACPSSLLSSPLASLLLQSARCDAL
mmetsp:Transcript_15146/g.36040  ORF Transcript_15146/g.36040 Transcript_15146/m.36040 type:complete len:182 (+) Transcript_15146:624-1169(+)